MISPSLSPDEVEIVRHEAYLYLVYATHPPSNTTHNSTTPRHTLAHRNPHGRDADDDSAHDVIRVYAEP